MIINAALLLFLGFLFIINRVEWLILKARAPFIADVLFAIGATTLAFGLKLLYAS